MDKQFCIFDMDGTLVDSMGYWKRLGREFLAQKGVTENVEPVLERIKPMTMTESAALFIESFSLSGTPEGIAAEMNAVMDEHYRRDVPLKPGAAAYVQALRSRAPGCAWPPPHRSPWPGLCLERLGVADQFAFLLSCDAVGSGKDRPDVFLEAAAAWGPLRRTPAAFEDAIYAARTAKQAGFYTVGIYDETSAGRWAEMTALADETIRDWREAL